MYATKLTLEQKLAKAQIDIMRTDPFFASLLLRMPVEAGPCKMMETNGKHIRYNPQWLDQLSAPEIGFILRHEVMHVALGHHLRMARMKSISFGSRNAVVEGDLMEQQKWNSAGDLAINSHFLNDPAWPDNSTNFPGSAKYPDFPAGENLERYYERLVQQDDPPAGSNEPDPQDPDNGSPERGGTDGQGSDDNPGQGDRDTDPESTPPGQDDDGGSEDGDGDTGSDTPGGSDAPCPPDELPGKADGDGGTGDSVPGDVDGSPGTADSGDGAGNGGESVSPELPPPDISAAGEFVPAAPGEEEAAQSEWEQRVAQAMIEAKSAGNMPGWIEEQITGMLEPAQVPWAMALRPFLNEAARTGWSFKRPDRRNPFPDVILPSMSEPTVGRILFLVDSSGSMSMSEMNAVLPELENIIVQFPDTVLEIRVFDTAIRDSRQFGATDLPIRMDTWTWKGRGGTKFIPVFRAIEKERPAPDLVVCLTDGQPCDGWPKQFPYPVLWLITTREKVPVRGHRIQMEVSS